MNRKRCAVVGIGHRSHSWIPQIVTTYKEQAELAALCDPVIARCHDVNKKTEKGLTLLNSDNRLITNY